MEACSNDNDVNEFLDTLQILANNDPDELDDMIRSAASNQTKEGHRDAFEFSWKEFCDFVITIKNCAQLLKLKINFFMLYKLK